MNLLYATDDNYAWIAGVSILSFLQNNKSKEKHNIFIMDDNISEENKIKLLSLSKGFNATIIFIEIREKIKMLIDNGVSGYAATDNMNMTAYARLFAAELLPESIERVLYLDCDTLILSNIHELEDVKYDGTMLMWPDCLRNEYKKVIGIPLNEKYYNSGIVLMDLKKWRNNNCSQHFFDHIKKVRADYPLVDQDIINISLRNEISESNNVGFNCLSQMLLYKYTDYKFIYGLDSDNWMNKQMFEATVNCPKILHMCGQTYIRPWYKNSHHPYKDEWKKYYLLSPWRDRELLSYIWSVPYKIQYFNNVYFKGYFDTLFAGIMQRVFICKYFLISK